MLLRPTRARVFQHEFKRSAVILNRSFHSALPYHQRPSFTPKITLQRVVLFQFLMHLQTCIRYQYLVSCQYSNILNHEHNHVSNPFCLQALARSIFFPSYIFVYSFLQFQIHISSYTFFPLSPAGTIGTPYSFGCWRNIRT